MVDRYFCNCRGMNYVPVYPEQWITNPTDLGTFSYEASVGGISIGSISIPETYKDISSPIAMWRWYSPSSIETQLKYLKNVGVNCVRVFLSYFVWHEQTYKSQVSINDTSFITNLKHFAATADSLKIRVMWVLWDDVGAIPGYQYPYAGDSIVTWTAQPGTPLATSSFLLDGSSFTHTIAGIFTTDVSFPPGKLYIRDVVNTVKNYQCTLYDTFNEPYRTQENVDFIRLCNSIIRSLDSDTSHAITVGFGGITAPYTPFVSSIVNDPNLDVISFHGYIVTKNAFDHITSLVEHVSEQLDTPKPIIITEGGSPGLYLRYESFMEFCQNQNLGFMMWSAIIGHPRGNHLGRGIGGFFHHDGTVREPLGVQKLVNLAVEDKVLPTFQTLPPVKTIYEDINGDNRPDFFTQYNSEPISEGSTVDKLMNLSPYIWGGKEILADIVSQADWTDLSVLTTANAFIKEYTRRAIKLTLITSDLSIFYETSLGVRNEVYASNFLTEEEENTLINYLNTLQTVNIGFVLYPSCLVAATPEDRTCFFINYDVDLEGINTFSLIQEDNEIFLTESGNILDFEQDEEFLFYTEDKDFFIFENDDFLEQEESNFSEEGFLLEEDYPTILLGTEDDLDVEAYEVFLRSWANYLGGLITGKGITA